MPSGLQVWVPAAASVAVLALAYGPLLAEFFKNQWAQPQYQFFPFVLAAFGWLLWRSCSQSRPKEATGGAADRAAMIVLLVAAWCLLALAYAAGSPWLAIISAILLVASRFVRMSNGWRVEYLWGIWALLWLLVPLPLGRDRLLVSWLQNQSSRLSSFFLDALGVHHIMDGNALRLPDKEFFVDEACSGIVSVMSVIACAVIYGIWRNRSPIHVFLLALAGMCWATLMNVVRITSIALAHDSWGVDWSTGTTHEILGLVVFTITFLLLVSTDYLLVALLAPIATESAESAGTPIHLGKRIVGWFDRLQAWGAPRTVKVLPTASARPQNHYPLWSQLALGLIPLLAFATLAGAQLTVPFLIAQPLPAAPHSVERALVLDEAALPPVVGGLQRIDFEQQERELDSILGQYSRVYRYRDDKGVDFLLSCDFPFEPSGHDLTICYTSVGWTQIGASNVHSVSSPNGWRYIEANFSKPEGRRGLLMFCAFNEFGEFVTPPTHALLRDLWSSLLKEYRSQQNTRTFQIQVWTASAGPISPQQAKEAEGLLLAVRDQIRKFIAKSGDATDNSAP